jgi:hypothetical protein
LSAAAARKIDTPSLASCRSRSFSSSVQGVFRKFTTYLKCSFSSSILISTAWASVSPMAGWPLNIAGPLRSRSQTMNPREAPRLMIKRSGFGLPLMR